MLYINLRINIETVVYREYKIIINPISTRLFSKLGVDRFLLWKVKLTIQKFQLKDGQNQKLLKCKITLEICRH